MIRYQSSTYAFQDSLAYGTGMDNREKISGNTVSVNLLGRWRPMRYFGADASFDYSLSGVFSDARILKLSAYAQLNPQNRLEGSYMNASYYAPLVARYYRSSFAMFNWKNDFKRIEANPIAVTLKSYKIINAQVKFTDISNYVYFDSLRTPRQFDDKVNVLSVTVSRDTRIRWLRMGQHGNLPERKFRGGRDATAGNNGPFVPVRLFLDVPQSRDVHACAHAQILLVVRRSDVRPVCFPITTCKARRPYSR